MTAVWALTWLGQSTALAALTAAFVRLPACRWSGPAALGDAMGGAGAAGRTTASFFARIGSRVPQLLIE
jgi:hypothetical protein